VKHRAVLLLSLLSFVSVSTVFATVLPDACGNEKVKFDIELKKNAPRPDSPEADKGQIVFIETSERPPKIGCFDAGLSCNDVARFGVDGAWVGATKGNSYFVISLEPGVHHLCVVLGKKVDAESLTVAPGKTYYFKVEYKAEGTQYGNSDHPNYQIHEKVEFSTLDEDNGKYRIKVSALSVAIPKHP
jgi:hypothetical protein